MDRAEQLSYLKVLLSITDNSQDEIFTELLDFSEQLALSIIFPYNKDRTELKVPDMYAFWVVLCAKEIYDKKDIGSSVQSYSENGISFNFSETTGILSYGLLGQLTPKARVPE